MFRRHLPRRRRRSSGAGSEPTDQRGGSKATNRLIHASVELLAERGVFGWIWADERLRVLHKQGQHVASVQIGADVCDALLPLYGMDDQLQALRRRPDHSFEIPNVAIMTGEGEPPRLNITVFWMWSQKHFLVLLLPAIASAELELEMTRQSRRRMLAEAQLVEQSRTIATANVELARANRDLVEFTTIVTHDLKAPMRAMRVVTEDLSRAIADPTGDDPQDHLARLDLQSRRMSAMLTDLLAYVRLDDDDNLEAFCTREMIDNIAASIPIATGFTLAISGDWPIVTVQRAPLDLVLRNLIENALKHHDASYGRVLVRSVIQDGVFVITVEDDGPGIRPDLHEAIFKPFTRLADEETDGLGMGLALVRRAVERAGAQLTLDSNPECARGTRFTLTWPTG